MDAVAKDAEILVLRQQLEAAQAAEATGAVRSLAWLWH
jgi:hypothetical protein